MALIQAVIAQIREQIEDGSVEDDSARFDQFVADGLGEVAFADSGRADQKDVFGFVQEAASGQIVGLETEKGSFRMLRYFGFNKGF